MLSLEDSNRSSAAQAIALACISTSKSFMKFCASPHPGKRIPTPIQVFSMLQWMNLGHQRYDARLEKAKEEDEHHQQIVCKGEH